MTSFPAAAEIPTGELATKMGIAFTEATPERVVATMPVAGNRQPFGLLHGGANAVLAETVGSVHAALLAGPGTAVVGIEISCSHHRSARDGVVTADCVPVHAGRQLSTFHITVRDDQGRSLCTARLTCFTRPA
jgi:uncharacterized protein (TIGR00369 family)